MRLDLFLKVSRLEPRRALAQKLCDANRVSLNGAKAKSSKEVKVGDVIELRRSNGVLRIRINELPSTKQVSKEFASKLYELISSEPRFDSD